MSCFCVPKEANLCQDKKVKDTKVQSHKSIDEEITIHDFFNQIWKNIRFINDKTASNVIVALIQYHGSCLRCFTFHNVEPM